MDTLHALGLNLAVVALFLSVWSNVAGFLADKPRLVRCVAFGLLMGTAAVGTMFYSISVEPGVFFDLRVAVLSTAALFGGPLVALISATIAAAYRISVGGSGALAGVTAIFLAGGMGSIVWLVARPTPKVIHVLALAAANTFISLFGLSLLTSAAAVRALANPELPLLTASSLAGLGIGLVLLRIVRRMGELDLLHAALAQAPDYLYVKDHRSQFVLANHNVAHFNGFSDPRQLVGLTDRNLTNPVRAELLLAQERRVMETGEAVINLEETLCSADGEQVFKTSKVPLRNSDGVIIGLAGVTRDVSERRRLESDITRSRDLLARVTDEMSDGLALFDADGRLVFCNSLYPRLFPRTSAVRRPGMLLRDILRQVIDTNEQLDLPDDKDAWIETVCTDLRLGGHEQVRLNGGRWLQVRTRPTVDGESIVVVADITDLKQREEELVAMATQLRTLATTDGLTGLLNRRSFDTAIEVQMVTTAGAGHPASLLLIDVDHFKAFNDTYGHPAGDECLKIIARAVAGALRSGDIVARYGGEELVAILPGATEEQALEAAGRIQARLADAAIPHHVSETGRVTVSIGVATYAAGARNRSSTRLIARADEALYLAKSEGRNRIVAWQDPGIKDSTNARRALPGPHDIVAKAS